MRPALAGEPGPETGLSIADKGRGGAIVPNRIDASCLALPPCGLPSSSLSSSLDSSTDQSSSSAGLDLVLLGAAVGSGSACCLARSCCVRRWNGFVSFFSEASGDVTLEVEAADWFMLLKNGFFDSDGGLDTAGGLVTVSGIGGGGGGGADVSGSGGAGGGSLIFGSSILCVGVLSAGVLRSTSSSLESSSSMLSSWRRSCLSRSLAASISAL